VRFTLLQARPSTARVAALLCIALLTTAAGVVVTETRVLDGVERDTIKARFDVRGTERPDDLVVVGIDAKSFDVLREQWPFPRSLHARAIRRLHEARARLIVYDVQFTEPTSPREDLALFRAIGSAGGAVLATSESDGHGHTDVLGGDENLARVNARAAASDLYNDRSGAVTRFPREVAGLESMAVAAAERTNGSAPRPAAFEDDGALIDYRGPPGTIRTVSFSDVVRGTAPRDAFENRIVVVGASAPTLRDQHSTPVGGDEEMAGAEVQANAIWTALRGLPLRSAPGWLGLLLDAIMGFLVPLVRARLPAPAAVMAALLAGAAYLVAAQLAFRAGVLLDVAAPLLTLALGTACTIAWSELAEARARREVARNNELLEARVRERTQELRETQLEIAHRLGAAVEYRDTETGLHIDRISAFCERLALDVGMDPQEAELLRHASALHDVGKVGVPDSILLKPGKLDPEEWATMQTHTTIGASILAGSPSSLVQLAETIALTHHERWDGSGYPEGLAREEIPLAGRICAICDVFDALLSPRPYKDAWPIEEVMAELERQRGSQFDPRLIDAFLPLAPELHREWFAADQTTERELIPSLQQ
jgi:response regulator RpfG family c-di-GMP phosphodiesterase